MIRFDEAVALVAEAARPLGSEQVSLADAHRRVLAEPVKAAITAPPVDVSAMDGYALRDADLEAGCRRFCLIGESFAGQGFHGEVPEGSCVRIFTGAPVPAGADRVVVQEQVDRDGDHALVRDGHGPARHIRKAGSDFRKGDCLLEPGTVLGPRALVAAAAADIGELTVFRRPQLIILATGDELAEPGQARLSPERIPESVSYGVAALCAEAGASFLGVTRLADDLGAMQRAASAALEAADVVVVTGGASVGERDFAKTMFEAAGLDLIFSKVAIKPGKPVWLGRAGGRLVMGLPGNPSSALVTARLLLVPLLLGMGGRAPMTALRWRSLPLAAELAATGGRETFSRGHERDGAAWLFDHQDSSAQKVLADATLLIRRPPGDIPVPVGSLVSVLDF